MNALPLISHHLFVAALENDSRPTGKLAADETAPPNQSRRARAIPLELVADVQRLSGAAARPLRASSSPHDA